MTTESAQLQTNTQVYDQYTTFSTAVVVAVAWQRGGAGRGRDGQKGDEMPQI